MSKHKKQRGARSWYWPLIVIFFSLIALSAISISVLKALHRAELSESFQRMADQYPSLIFEQVRFSKYMVYGTVPESSRHLASLDILLVQGLVDISCDVSLFSLNTQRTDWLNRVLVLDFDEGFSGAHFPVGVSVLIQPENVRLVESLRGEPWSDEEIDAITKPVAVGAGIAGAAVGAGAGAVAGGVAGGSLSAFITPMRFTGGIGRVLGTAGGAAVGAAAGGALASGAAVVSTEHFLSSVIQVGKYSDPVMSVLSAGKSLIALEVLAGERISSNDWEKETKMYYEKEARESIRSLALGFGWKRVMFSEELSL